MLVRKIFSSFTMINVMDYVKKPMNEAEKTLDSQLWHACAGGMVQMPPLNSQVLYFPQGHAEHAGTKSIDSSYSRRIPPYILCQVSAVSFMADPDTDEVYSKIRLLPLRNQNNNNFQDDGDNNQFLGFDRKTNESKEKPSSFAKTLTQSDANNGGGFSVPRYCAETIFPKLDYAADPPVQTILVKDVHGQIWKFRHIYRGTPRRHLLTTGWSNFVNHKKLVAGDSIVFLRADNGELCVGIRRAKRGIGGGFFDIPNAYNVGCKASVESVIEAVNHAVNGDAFEVVYYPRASTPEFCVKASTVKAAMRIQWCPGMRFKMPFETEDSSRISWFMGTVSGVQVEDQIRWPNSPWRLLQVAWDEPELLQNVKRVNPWLVELVASMPAIHLSPFSPPFPNGFTNHDSLRRFPFQERHENSSCLLTIGNNNPKVELKKKNEETKKKPMFVLFGQPILTAQQLSESVSGDTDGDGSVVLQNDSVRSSSEEDAPWVKTGHCKVFLESDDMGRTLDLTALNSYEELYIDLASMFGLEKTEISSNLIYLNGAGAVKHTGDEPFSEFSKVARRLTILTDSGSGNVGC
ncbi:auxin response factor 16-like protein [Tanacetum coccineum]